MATDTNSESYQHDAAQAEYLDKLKNAPIAEVAAFIGKDIDAAVALRVEAAQKESAFMMMDISVRPIEPKNGLHGFASVTVGCIKIDDFKIAEKKNGELFVGMPSKPDKSSNTGYRNTVFIDKDLKDSFNAVVLGKYHEAVDKAQSRAANLKPADRISDQVEKAQKEADKHNSKLPPKEKTSQKRGKRGG